jgi:hypothetical protein
MITLGLVPAMLAMPHRVRETHQGHGLGWVIGRFFTAPIRWIGRLFGGRRAKQGGPAADAAPAE